VTTSVGPTVISVMSPGWISMRSATGQAAARPPAGQQRLEADLEPAAYGYRPGRSAIDAVKAVHRLLCQGFANVVDADLSRYFDTITHDGLLRSVAARIVDRHVLRLIKLWLKRLAVWAQCMARREAGAERALG
jgi:RNA-directed DNA polymerase